MLDSRDHIIEAYDFACDDDASAEEMARGLMAEMRHAHAVEIWVRPRLVTRVGGQRTGAASLDERAAEPRSGRV